MKNYIVLMRPVQWVKNLFILLPLFFGLKITDTTLLGITVLAAFFFSLVASAVYIFNDYHDKEEDKNHPLKRTRPFPSGKVSTKNAFILMSLLLVAGCVGLWLIAPAMFYIVLAYVLLNVSYTLKLKHIALLDIMIIAVGFVIRLIVGSVITGIPLSHWIILMTFLLALFIALAKRRDDVLIYLNGGEMTRKTVDGYNLEFLNAAMVVAAAAIIVFYIMYTVSPEIAAKIHTDKLYFTSVFVVLGILRYLQITFVENDSGSPTEILLKDKIIIFSVLAWALTFIALIY
ncbi:decaprenyl-phosphate phosphoribosyltransferase [Candidatus Peregrinibacteria bacterium]|nr:decaprenyl-phosphate phosphoribosyltransferase [Candidatus Peregrinibacteria bacterium]